MSVRKSITLPLMIFLFYAAAPLDRIELLFYDCGEEIEAPPPERDATCPPLLCGIPFAFGLHFSPNHACASLYPAHTAIILRANRSPGWSWHSLCSNLPLSYSAAILHAETAGKGYLWHSIPDTLIAMSLDYPSQLFMRGCIVASRRQRGETFDESRRLQRTV